MATRSSITVKSGDKYVGVYCHNDGYPSGVYCHNDGYPSGVGETLFNHYNTQAQVEALVALGALSQLHPELATSQPHSFDDPVSGVTIAYARDRGGDMLQTTGKTWTAVKDKIDGAYHYLYENGVWVCTDEYGDFESVPLSQFIGSDGSFGNEPV
jgi:alkylation response protein AidB-like acyl-CoA dehydrogenase